MTIFISVLLVLWVALFIWFIIDKRTPSRLSMGILYVTIILNVLLDLIERFIK